MNHPPRAVIQVRASAPSTCIPEDARACGAVGDALVFFKGARFNIHCTANWKGQTLLDDAAQGQTYYDFARTCATTPKYTVFTFYPYFSGDRQCITYAGSLCQEAYDKSFGNTIDSGLLKIGDVPVPLINRAADLSCTPFCPFLRASNCVQFQGFGDAYIVSTQNLPNPSSAEKLLRLRDGLCS
jgi:hypothetical protein